MDFSAYQNYYLLKCFEKEEYMKDFNSGEKLFINSFKVFHKLENEFQGDFEGGILYKHSGVKMITANREISLEEALSCFKGDVSEDIAVFPIEDFRFYLNGFVVCFFIMHKAAFIITDSGICLNPKSKINEQLSAFLDSYAKESGQAFITVYDAKTFLEKFWPSFESKGYNVSAGCVEYEDSTIIDRANWYNNREYDRIVFTKDVRFAYQKEFRIIVQRDDTNDKTNISEKTDGFYPAIVWSGKFESNWYIEERERLKNETNT